MVFVRRSYYSNLNWSCLCVYATYSHSQCAVGARKRHEKKTKSARVRLLLTALMLKTIFSCCSMWRMLFFLPRWLCCSSANKPMFNRGKCNCVPVMCCICVCVCAKIGSFIFSVTSSAWCCSWLCFFALSSHSSPRIWNQANIIPSH